MSKILLSAFLLLSTIFLGGCFSSCGETAQIQKNMTDGLKKIYGKEFVVERPHMTGDPGFGYHYESRAYPKDNPDVKFTVAYDMNQDGKYGENYLVMLWSHQGRQELYKMLRSIYGDDFIILTYSFDYFNKDFKSLNHSETLKASGGLVRLAIKYIIFTDKIIDKNQEADHNYKIMKHLIINNHLQKYHFIVGYSPMKYKYNKYFENEYGKSGKSVDELFKEGILSNYIDIIQVAMNTSEVNKVELSNIVSSFK